jgi:hypothetical protein
LAVVFAGFGKSEWLGLVLGVVFRWLFQAVFLSLGFEYFAFFAITGEVKHYH